MHRQAKKTSAPVLDYGQRKAPAPGDGSRASRGSWFDRRWLVVCCVIATLLIAFAYAGDQWQVLAYWLFVDGAILAAWLLAAGGYGWVVMRRVDAPWALKVVTAVGLGLGFVGFMVLFLGLSGVVHQVVGWIVVGIGAGLAIFWLVLALRGDAQGERQKRWWRAAAGWEVLWVIATPFLGFALVAALVSPGILWPDEPAGYDVAEYHLQVPREWYEAGRVSGLRHNVFSYMPMGVEVHYLLAMQLRGGPYEGMYLAQLMHVALVALGVWATGAVAGALSERAWSGPVAGAAAAAVPWLTALAPLAYNEGGLLVYGTLAIGWALRAKDWRSWAVGGAAGGLACGAKLTAVPTLIVGVVIALLVATLVERLRRAPQAERLNVAGVGVFVGVAVGVFLPWMIRNWAWTGNPVFPQGMGVLGKGHFSDVQVERWKRAHSPRKDQKPIAERLRAGWQQMGADWRYGFVFLPVVAVGVVGGAVLRDRRVIFLGVLILFQLGFWLTFTHLQGRFFVLAIPAGAIVIAMVKDRVLAALCALLIVVVATINLNRHHERFTQWPYASSMLGYPSLQAIAMMRFPVDFASIPEDQKIIVVGDALAFFYSDVPMSRLRYRTVFDVPPPGPGKDWVDAWTGGERGVVAVFPSELRRFRRTYYEVPGPPDEELNRSDAPYLLKR